MRAGDTASRSGSYCYPRVTWSRWRCEVATQRPRAQLGCGGLLLLGLQVSVTCRGFMHAYYVSVRVGTQGDHVMGGDELQR